MNNFYFTESKFPTSFFNNLYFTIWFQSSSNQPTPNIELCRSKCIESFHLFLNSQKLIQLFFGSKVEMKKIKKKERVKLINL